MDYAQLQTTQQRDDFIAQFWARRDPTPGTTENEFRDEYERRIRLARQQYTIPDFPGVFGHDTDRGRVHVMFGAPDNIDKGEIGAGLHRSLGEVAHIFDPAGISCTAMLPAGTYTFSAAVTLVAGGTQSDTVAFEVPWAASNRIHVGLVDILKGECYKHAPSAATRDFAVCLDALTTAYAPYRSRRRRCRRVFRSLERAER
jgi:GWxTD domain-containing protein